MRITFCRSVLIAVGCAAVGMAQNRETIPVGTAELRLGMTKAQVRVKIAEEFVGLDLPSFWEKDIVMLVDKVSDKYVGSLNFVSDKLASVERPWTSSTNAEAIAVGKAIYALISQRNEQGESLAIVKTRAVREPDFTGEIVEISFGSRVIQISIKDGRIMEHRIKDVAVAEYVIQKGLK